MSTMVFHFRHAWQERLWDFVLSVQKQKMVVQRSEVM